MRTFLLFHMQKIIIPSDIVKLLAGADKRKSASYYSQVSRTIAEFKAERLIICLNPKEKTGRLYKLTKIGSSILKKLS